MAAALALLLLARCSIPGLRANELVQIPDKDEYGEIFALQATVCRPAGSAPAPILVLNHGSPVPGGSRGDIRPLACSSAAVRWFVDRGYLVVLPMRRGYGTSGGAWAEDPGPCSSPDYARAAREGAHDIALTVAIARKLPGARPDGLVVLGWDIGGLATLAYAGGDPPADARAIVMAAYGGARGDAEAGHVCRPDLLVEAAGQLGATARIPSLWVYAGNDRLVTPELALAMVAAFNAAGGRVRFALTGEGATEGHDLFFAPNGPVIWGPVVETFLAR